MTPAAWMVLFGDQQQFKALFVEQARAEQFAATHHGIVRPLHLIANASLPYTLPAGLQSSEGTA